MHLYPIRYDPGMAHAKTLIAEDDWMQISLLSSTIMLADEHWHYNGVQDTYWRFYVNSRPTGLVRGSGWSHALEPGLIHLVPPWLRFDCRCTGLTEHFFAHFDLVGLPGSVVRTVFPRPVAVRPSPGLALELAQVRTGMAEARWPGTVLLLRLKGLIGSAVAAAIAALPPHHLAQFETAARGRQAIAPALMLIDFGIQIARTNAALARACGMGETRFVRAFRASMGQTPAQYLIERRISWAAERLRLGDEPLETIAQQAGFPDRFYFTRMFTRRMGTPPARYRRQELARQHDAQGRMDG